uniref:copper amine oxidase N-terminal domain-containing protein n=1 Tax=Desulfotruncus alcoholivorax TaxID=265477 RepID=UPI000488D3E2
GRVGSGDVDIVVTDDPTFSDNDTTTIRVDESVNDTLDNEAESLKFTLPNGFEWGAVSKVTVLWGEASVKVNNGATQTISGAQLENVLKAAFTADNKKLKLNLASIKYDINGDGTVDTLTEFSSTKAISFKFEAPITVSDETEAQVGDVVAQIDGDTSHNQNEIVVGHYGQFETSISAGEPTNIVSGQLAQKIADIKIKESIKGSLVPGRTLLLTLPSNYKWGKIDTDSDNSAGLTFEGFPGKDGKTAKWTFTGPSTDAAELTLSGMEVAVEPGTTGDLVIEAGGTAGLTGELTVAKVSQPVAIKASATPVLSIGKNGQAVGDLTVTENVAGAISDNNDLILQLPEGFKWSKYSDIKVTEGNLKIDDGGITTGNNDRDLIIPIDSDSSVASTIELKNLEVGVDRTAPEGDVTVKVKGAAVGEVNNESDVKDEYGTAVGGYLRVSDKDCFPVNSDYQLFPETATAAKTVLATVGTPAPGESKLTTTVTLGDNGSYISGGRIMVQLRDAANALGVAPQNIFWDNATKTATFIKGDRVAQITVGVSQVKLNGVALPTDKGAELKDGRTFVSLSQAGIALGAAASWDNTTKTATLTVK